MTKHEFLRQLTVSLKRLPEEEWKDILKDYEEHFAIGQEEGKSEQEIAKALGSPQQIAKELLASYHLEKVGTAKNAGNLMRAIWAVIGLGFFNLVIVLGPVVAIAGVIIGFWGMSIGFILSPLVVLYDFMRNPEAFQPFNLFSSLALTGLGLLLGLGLYYLSKALIRGLVRYLNYNVSLVKGGLKAS